jgi:hypothetical protein
MRRILIRGGIAVVVIPVLWYFASRWCALAVDQLYTPRLASLEAAPLGDIQPERWLAEYTTELLNVLHVLGRLVALEPAQADLLDRICAAPTLNEEALEA